MSAPDQRYGLLNVYREPEPLIAAATELKRRGDVRLDAFTPYPVPELDEVLGADAKPIPWIVLAGGVLGAIAPISSFFIRWRSTIRSMSADDRSTLGPLMS